MTYGQAMSRTQSITQRITSTLKPTFLEVENESHQHNVTQPAETHFKITIVAEQFEDLSKIARHRLLYSLLAEELNTGLHALSLHLYTPQEWERCQSSSPQSPACRGGHQREKN